MAMSNAERQRKFRANRDKDPERRCSYLNKQKSKYKEDKELGKKKCKKDMTSRELRTARKQWKVKQRKQREKLKKIKQIIACTPPDSPLQNHEEFPGPSRQERQSSKQRIRERSKCYRDNVRLETQLSIERKKTDLYKRRWLRARENKHNQNATDDTPRTKTRKLLGHLSNKTVKKTLVFHHALVDQLKNSYTSSTNKSEKKQMSRILAGSIVRKYRMKSVAFKLCGIGVHHKPKKHKSSLSRRMCKIVQNFFERDDVSRIAAGKKNTVTEKKNKKQRRILGDSMKNLYVKYCAEEHKQSLSYTTFCRLRPFWVKYPNDSDRNTCQCKTCENTKFMAISLERKQVIETSELEEIITEVVCDKKNKECMYNNCRECKQRKIKIKSDKKEEDIEWFQWLTKTEKRMVRGTEKNIKLTVKEMVSGSVCKLIDEFQSALIQYKKHTFNIRAQFSYFKRRKESLKNNECLIHVDFSENYVCKMAEEIHSMHFGASKKQLSLHTGVYYIGNGKPNTFCTVSDNLCHEPGAIWAHLQPILNNIKSSNPELDHIEFFSDGPTTQYRQKANFFLLSTEPFKLGFHKVVWNFFESGHGKGTPDAVGGSIKRKADNLVKYGNDIISAASFVDQVNDGSTATKLITTDEILKGQQLLDNVKLKVVTGTMKIHQIVSSSARSILYRDVSCYCDNSSGICMNHSFKSFKFDPERVVEQGHEKNETDKPVLDESPDIVMPVIRTRRNVKKSVLGGCDKKAGHGAQSGREVGTCDVLVGSVEESGAIADDDLKVGSVGRKVEGVLTRRGRQASRGVRSDREVGDRLVGRGEEHGAIVDDGLKVRSVRRKVERVSTRRSRKASRGARSDREVSVGLVGIGEYSELIEQSEPDVDGCDGEKLVGGLDGMCPENVLESEQQSKTDVDVYDMEMMIEGENEICPENILTSEQQSKTADECDGEKQVEGVVERCPENVLASEQQSKTNVDECDMEMVIEGENEICPDNVPENEQQSEKNVGECNMEMVIDGVNERCQDKVSESEQQSKTADACDGDKWVEGLDRRCQGKISESEQQSKTVDECDGEKWVEGLDGRCQGKISDSEQPSKTVDECDGEKRVEGLDGRCQGKISESEQQSKTVDECDGEKRVEGLDGRCQENVADSEQQSKTVDECDGEKWVEGLDGRCQENVADSEQQSKTVDECDGEKWVEGLDGMCQGKISESEQQSKTVDECEEEKRVEGLDGRCQENVPESEQQSKIVVDECGMRMLIECVHFMCPESVVESEETSKIVVDECDGEKQVEGLDGRCQVNALESEQQSKTVDECDGEKRVDGLDGRYQENALENEQPSITVANECDGEKPVDDSDKTCDSVWLNVPSSVECIDKYVIVKYQRNIYPGYVQNVSGDELLIKCMKRIGPKKANCFIWPKRCTDISWYCHNEILAVIPEPKIITGRGSHFEVCMPIWNKLQSNIRN